jgi:DNA-binding HxlR family transcriptional regulator
MQVTRSTGAQRRTQRKTRKQRGLPRSPCPVANTLDLIGDRWSLLVVRDMLRGKRTYGDLLDSPEGIPTNILAERLKRLEDAGVIVSSVYQERPIRRAYALSETGTALGDVLLALVRWGKRHIPGTRTLTNFRSAPVRERGSRRSTRTSAKTPRAR